MMKNKNKEWRKHRLFDYKYLLSLILLVVASLVFISNHEHIFDICILVFCSAYSGVAEEGCGRIRSASYFHICLSHWSRSVTMGVQPSRPPQSRVARQRRWQAHSKYFYLAGTFYWFSCHISLTKQFLMLQFCIIIV